MSVQWQRYVAIGDSTTEGLDDPDGRGGYRGWANRLAERLAAQPAAAVGEPFRYANLAVRGRLTAEVRAEQLPVALRLQPDLVTAVAGLNDALRPRFEPAAVGADLHAMFSALAATGATVLTFTMPDPGPIMPAFSRVLRPRVAALNETIKDAGARAGAVVVDLGSAPVASDPRLWSLDRLHANSAGHAWIAAALAEALGLPGSDGSWRDPLPPLPARRAHEVAAAELAWVRRHFLPWLARHVRGRSSGDGVTAKRPQLLPMPPEAVDA